MPCSWAAGASPIDSEDEGDVVVVDEDRPAGSVQTVQTAQTANQRRDATASDGRGADGDADAAAEAGELRAALALSVSGSGTSHAFKADACSPVAHPACSCATVSMPCMCIEKSRRYPLRGLGLICCIRSSCAAPSATIRVYACSVLFMRFICQGGV